jgi:tetratricopeptide (TPR) repeat protein
MKKALRPEYIAILNIINNLSFLYTRQNKLDGAEKIYQHVLQEIEKALKPEHISILTVINGLGNLYRNQKKLSEAEKIYDRAL